jgi:hypothetical protein
MAKRALARAQVRSRVITWFSAKPKSKHGVTSARPLASIESWPSVHRDIIGWEWSDLLPHIEDDLRTGAFEMNIELTPEEIANEAREQEDREVNEFYDRMAEAQ